jgi:hypothetical protein
MATLTVQRLDKWMLRARVELPASPAEGLTAHHCDGVEELGIFVDTVREVAPAAEQVDDAGTGDASNRMPSSRDRGGPRLNRINTWPLTLN